MLRTNLVGREPEQMWEFYMQLVQVEEAFKNLKGDLAIRPIHHQKEERIEAHIFVAFMAYAMHVNLRDLAPGLPAGSGKVRCNDRLHLPTTSHDAIHSLPIQVLLEQLRLSLPSQLPPRVTATK